MIPRYGWLALFTLLLAILGPEGRAEERMTPVGGIQVGERWLVYELPVGVYQSKPKLLRYFSKGGSGKNILEVLSLNPDPFLEPREGLQAVEKALSSPEGSEIQNSINRTLESLRTRRKQLERLYNRHAEGKTSPVLEGLLEIEKELKRVRKKIVLQKAESQLFLGELRRLQEDLSQLQKSGENLRLQVLQESAVRNKAEILQLTLTELDIDGQSYPTFASSPDKEALKVVLVRAEGQDIAFLFRKHPKDNFKLDEFVKGVLGSLRSSEQKPEPPLLQRSRNKQKEEESLWSLIPFSTEHSLMEFAKGHPKLTLLTLLILVSSFAAFIAAGPAHRNHKGEAFVSAPRALMVLLTVASPTLIPVLLLGGAGIASGSPRFLLIALPLGLVSLGGSVGAAVGIKRGLSRSEFSCRALAALGVPVGMLLALGILMLGGFGTRV